jgi:CheY-like chemotaxis protein
LSRAVGSTDQGSRLKIDRPSPQAEAGASSAERTHPGVVLIHSDPEAWSLAEGWLRARGGPHVIAKADSAPAGLSLVRGFPRKRGVIVVVDLALSGEHDAFWLIRAIRDHDPVVPIVAVGDGDEGHSSRAYRLGADAVVDHVRTLLDWLSTGDLRIPRGGAGA